MKPALLHYKFQLTNVGEESIPGSCESIFLCKCTVGDATHISMLDPVSILGAMAAASQLIEQSGKMVLFFSELYWKVQDTPDLIRKQKIHIEQLILLSQLIKENPSLQTAPIASILQSCLKAAQPLSEALTKISVSDADGKSKRIQKVISALIKEKHISASLGDLEREKNSLILCIQEIDSYVMFTLYIWIYHLIRIRKLLHAIQITIEDVKTEVRQVSLVVNDSARDMKEVVQSLPEISENVRDMHQILPNVARDVQAIVQFTVRLISPNYEKIGLILMQLTKRPTTFRNTMPVPETHTVAKSFYMVPNRRVRAFIGREDILGKIEDGFSAEGRPCVMVIRAMGGQGKTQVALEYCHRAKDQRFKAIFWLDAMSESSLRKGFRTIAERIKPLDMIIDDDSGVDLVLEKLGEWPEPWLMIFDNYDDPKTFNNLQEYIPGEDGCFLVTTRHADTDAMTDPENVIELPGLDERSALDLLFKLSQTKETEINVEEGKHIVGRLGFHPLAITQAGTYMKLRKIKLRDFLAYYKRQRLSILQQTPQMSQYRRKLGKLNEADTETALNVFTTWELSFQLLLASETSGTSNTSIDMEGDLLTLFAFFDCKDISEELFKAFCVNPKFQESRNSTGFSLRLDLLLDESGNWDEDKFASILITLNQHALLQ
jgi:NB-ARC domain